MSTRTTTVRESGAESSARFEARARAARWRARRPLAVAVGLVVFALRQAMPEREVGKGLGHFFGAMRVDAFREVEEFKSQMDDFIRTLRATRPAPGTSGPLLPGDPERAAQKERDAGGVPVLGAVLEDLRDIARLTGVPLE